MNASDSAIRFVPREETCTDYHDPGCMHNRLDRVLTAALARATLGVTPAGLFATGVDWWSHWLLAPGKQLHSAQKALRNTARAWEYAFNAMMPGIHAECIAPLPQDQRFRSEHWQRWPFNVIQQSFLLYQQWCHVTVSDVPGMPKDEDREVAFAIRQLLDMASPSNVWWLNPEVVAKTIDARGFNLLNGLRRFQYDVMRVLQQQRPAEAGQFEVGKDLAITPGKVVFRNDLIELIQYQPQSQTVWREPVLIISAWIMKYYILDLSPENSLVNYLLQQGHTVFIVSWKNPVASDADLSMEDYRTQGVMAAIDCVNGICGDARIHAVGYCLGGTMLTIAAAAMARQSDERLVSVTLFAAQTDFSEPGELGLFISESEVTYLEAMMEQQGYLDARQMMGAFQLLRSNDLVWSRMIREYLLDDSTPMNDLMAWNSDLTRMPYRMHSQYLRRLYLHNALATGHYRVEDRPVVVTDIRAPLFCVGTEKDHVAPWRSVYKIHMLSDTEVTFLLTSGGHNAGIVSPPGHPHREYHVKTTRAEDRYLAPDAWIDVSQKHEGSWWPEWQQWLVRHSSGLRITPPLMGNGNVLEDAPGTYVLQH